jgi:hypothetical protein
VAPNLVVSEDLRGYLLHGRLLRATKVVVSRQPGQKEPGKDPTSAAKAENATGGKTQNAS